MVYLCLVYLSAPLSQRGRNTLPKSFQRLLPHLASWHAVLRINTRVAPPFRPLPAPDHSPEEDIDGQCGDGRARIKSGTDDVDVAAVGLWMPIGEPLVCKDRA